jgi:radical SAM protein with 4Fe4S-binding SPASM domain
MLDVKLKLRPGHTEEREWLAPSPLKTLFWNMTYACNFDCGICFTDSGAARLRELDTREAMDLVGAAHDAGVRDVLISGGEPFLRPDILPILARMGEFGITGRIASNGSLLDSEVLKRLRGETRVKSFQISLDTMNPETYAILHGTSADTHSLVMRNLALIRDFGFHTTVSTRLTPMTLDGIPALLDAAVREGWSTVTVHCPLHTNRANGAFGQAEDVLGRLRPVLEHFERLDPHWLVETYIPWAEYHPLVRHFEGRIRFIHRGCRAGRDRLTVNPTGMLSPCVCLDVPAAHVGDVRKDCLGEVFSKSPLCDMFRNPARHGLCAGCPEMDRCGGGCRASAYVLTGRIDGQDESCPVWQAGITRRAGT